MIRQEGSTICGRWLTIRKAKTGKLTIRKHEPEDIKLKNDEVEGSETSFATAREERLGALKAPKALRVARVASGWVTRWQG